MPCNDFIPEGKPALLVTYELHQPTEGHQRNPQGIIDYLCENFHDPADGLMAWRIFPTTWVLIDEGPGRTQQRPHPRSTAGVFGELIRATHNGRPLFDDADRLLVMDLRSPDYAPVVLTEAERWLPGWLPPPPKRRSRKLPPTWLVVVERGEPPIYDFMDKRPNTVHPFTASWFEQTDLEASVYFKWLTGQRVAGKPVVDGRDRLSVVNYPPIAHQNLDEPELSPREAGVQVTYRKHRLPSLGEYMRSKPRWWHNVNHAWIFSEEAKRTNATLMRDLKKRLADYDGLFLVDFWSDDFVCAGVETPGPDCP